MNRRVLITGGSRGIGAACVRAFRALGDRVVFIYRSRTGSADALCRETGASCIRADISDGGECVGAVRRALSVLGGADVLVNCAGIAEFSLFQDITDEDWDRMFDINIKGVYRSIQAALPYLMKRERSRIVTFSSMWGQVGASCESHYAASKGAVIALTQSLAKELGPSGVRVNCVSPGTILTDMTAVLGQETLDALAEETPLERNGSPEDAARAAAFLCSEAADFITGQVVAVNGGYIV